MFFEWFKWQMQITHPWIFDFFVLEKKKRDPMDYIRNVIIAGSGRSIDIAASIHQMRDVCLVLDTSLHESREAIEALGITIRDKIQTPKINHNLKKLQRQCDTNAYIRPEKMQRPKNWKQKQYFGRNRR